MNKLFDNYCGIQLDFIVFKLHENSYIVLRFRDIISELSSILLLPDRIYTPGYLTN